MHWNLSQQSNGYYIFQKLLRNINFRVSELYYLNQQEPIVPLQVHVIKTFDAIECNQCQTTQLILLLFADLENSESILETKVTYYFSWRKHLIKRLENVVKMSWCLHRQSGRFKAFKFGQEILLLNCSSWWNNYNCYSSFLDSMFWLPQQTLPPFPTGKKMVTFSFNFKSPNPTWNKN